MMCICPDDFEQMYYKLSKTATLLKNFSERGARFDCCSEVIEKGPGHYH
jgi:hypothetical protein